MLMPKLVFYCIERNNNIRTVRSESSKFATRLFDQISNRRVVENDLNAVF